MNVEIIGGGFANKGGQLMTIAVQEMLRSWDPAHRLYMPLNDGTRSDRSNAGFGSALHFDSNRYTRLNGIVQASSSLVPSSRNLIAESDIDVVLDISGFAYSDSWGPRTAVRRAEMYRQKQDRGASIVIMPQAFGPFVDDMIRDAVGSIVSSASLTFARDPISLGYLNEIEDLPATVLSAPDFTNLLVPDDSVPAPSPPAPVAIVPNARMLDKTDSSQAQKYVQFVHTCIEHLAESVGAYLLIHETRDIELAQQLAQGSPAPVEIVTETDPLILKRYLGTSLFVVGSRFHALVSALSQGVPVLAVGWSHKYEALLADYHQTDKLLAVDSSPIDIRRRLDELAVSAMSSGEMADLQSAAETQKQDSRAMWTSVRTTTGL
jgi:colanic acid/amylovoran biosynthesis protein